MKGRLSIRMRNGESYMFEPDEWDDYSYDRTAFIVMLEGRWIAVFNFEDVSVFQYIEDKDKDQRYDEKES